MSALCIPRWLHGLKPIKFRTIRLDRAEGQAGNRWDGWGRGLTCARYTTRCQASISFRALATCEEGLTFLPDLIVTGKSLTRSKVPLGHVARPPYTITLESWPYALQGDMKKFDHNIRFSQYTTTIVGRRKQTTSARLVIAPALIGESQALRRQRKSKMER